jgi:putative oligomerization/nucleic acid binding protein
MPRGGFGGGFGRGGFGRGFGMRRYGAPLVMPMGGWGMGMGGYGSPLLTSLLAGGVGYALGSNSAQQNQRPPAYQPYPYPYPYQAPPPATPAPSPGADSGQLAQLKLLGELRDSGVLTDDEFERQKQRILGG